jgi:hypothetical protein
MKKTWDQMLIESLNDFNDKRPNALKRIKQEIPDSDVLCDLDEDSETFKLYWEAAGHLVEPSYNRNSDEEMKEMEYYHDKTEEDGFDFVKGLISGVVEDAEDWKHIADLVNEYGY